MLELTEFLQVLALSVLMVVGTSLIFYEIMYVAWLRIELLKASHRLKIFILILTIFASHTICVWLYGILYYLMWKFGFGDLIILNRDSSVKNFADFIYFSAITYSSLGYIESIPSKQIKFMTGVEVLNGLVLIAWSASYTYIMMEKFWDIRKKKK